MSLADIVTLADGTKPLKMACPFQAGPGTLFNTHFECGYCHGTGLVARPKAEWDGLLLDALDKEGYWWTGYGAAGDYAIRVIRFAPDFHREVRGSGTTFSAALRDACAKVSWPKKGAA